MSSEVIPTKYFKTGFKPPLIHVFIWDCTNCKFANQHKTIIREGLVECRCSRCRTNHFLNKDIQIPKRRISKEPVPIKAIINQINKGI